MIQAMLNHSLMCHVYKNTVDNLDKVDMVNEFLSTNQRPITDYFGKPWTLLFVFYAYIRYLVYHTWAGENFWVG